MGARRPSIWDNIIKKFSPIVLVFRIGVMINMDSQERHSYFIVRCEILRFMKYEQL
jgi:hypothetical protein